jgi:hypothetical protein
LIVKWDFAIHVYYIYIHIHTYMYYNLITYSITILLCHLHAQMQYISILFTPYYFLFLPQSPAISIMFSLSFIIIYV